MDLHKITVLIPSDTNCREDLKIKAELLKPIIGSIAIKKDEYCQNIMVFRDRRIKNLIFRTTLTNFILSHNPKTIREKLKILRFFN